MSEYVMSGRIETHGQTYRIDLASPELFAQWCADIIRHRPPNVTGPATIMVTYSGRP